LQTSGRSNASGLSTLTSSLYRKEQIIVQNFKQYVIYVYNVGFAKHLRLLFVPNQVSPRFLKLFKPSYDVEFQTTPLTRQKKDQLTCGR
jgi:hypothetical protein